MVESLTQTHTLQHAAGILSGARTSAQLQCQHDVFQSGQRAQQLKALKDKAHVLGPHGGAGIFIAGKQVFTGQTHGAVGGRIQSRHDGQQGAFAGTRGPHNGHGFSALQLKINIAENIQCAGGIGDRFGHVGNFKNGFCHVDGDG